MIEICEETTMFNTKDSKVLQSKQGWFYINAGFLTSIKWIICWESCGIRRTRATQKNWNTKYQTYQNSAPQHQYWHKMKGKNEINKKIKNKEKGTLTSRFKQFGSRKSKLLKNVPTDDIIELSDQIYVRAKLDKGSNEWLTGKYLNLEKSTQ